MVGIVLVAHGRIAEAILNVIEGILGPAEAVEAITTSPWDGSDVIQARLEGAIRRVDSGSGVLILTDMLGDTQTNVSLALAEQTGAEVVAGVNMPILIKAAAERDRMEVRDLAALLTRYGQEHICWATEARGPAPRRVAR